jgi:hypothetical protein
MAILSNRTLKFYNNETVYEIDLKQTAFIPTGRFTSEVIVDTGTGEVIEERPRTNVDALRYLTGLARYKDETIVDVDGRPAPSDVIKTIKDLPGVSVRRNEIIISETTQLRYRIPFYKIRFSNTSIEHAEENSIFYKSTSDIRLFFRSLEWVVVFYNQEIFREFLERGDLEGPKYRQVTGMSGLDLDNRSVVGHYIRKAEETMRQLGFGNLKPLKTIENRVFEDLGRLEVRPVVPPSLTYSDFKVETLAQVPETTIRRNNDELSTLKFLVDENYNFLSREFEFGNRAPANKKNTNFPETLMPSAYVISALASLADRYSNEEDPRVRAQINARGIELAKALLLGGQPRFLDLGVNILNPLIDFSLTQEFFDNFGFKVKRTTNSQISEAEEQQENSNYVIIDQEITKNFSNTSLFPFYNIVTITDLPSFSNTITRTLINSGLNKGIVLRLMDFIKNPIEAENRLEETIGLFATVSPDVIGLGQQSTKRKQVFTLDMFSGQPNTSRITGDNLQIDFGALLNSINAPLFFRFLTSTPYVLKTPETLRNIVRDLRQINLDSITPYVPTEDIRSESTMSFMDFLNITTEFTEDLQRISRNRIPTAKQLLLGEKDSYFEPIAYKVTKRNVTTNETQEFLFINGEEEQVEFIDSQLKFNQEYDYSLSSFNFILENNYFYETLPPSEFEAGIDFSSPGQEFVFGTRMNVVQAPKVLELPLATESSVNVDAPPIRPNVEFYPVKDFEDRVKIRLSSMNSVEFADPIIIENADRQLFASIRNSQKIGPNDKIRFASDETPMAYEVFRLEEMPRSITDFAGTKRIAKSITSNNESTDGTLIQDAIRPNVEYYYLFRTLDFHGKVSNPTEIFKFVLIENDGSLIPVLTVIPLDQLGKLEPQTREVRRFIEILPSARQTVMPRNQFAGKTSDGIRQINFGNNSVQVDTSNSILDNKFLIEVKSKKTGKSIYLELDYEINNSTIRQPGPRRRAKIRTTVTQADVEQALRRREEE